MGYFPFRLKCKQCGHEWNSFFCSVDMSSGAQICTCGSVEVEKIADEWRYEENKD